MNVKSEDLIFMSKLFSVLFILLVVFPFRIRYEFLIFNSVSIFDLALLGFGMLLLLFVLQRDGRLYTGNKTVLFLLCIPLGIGLFSLAWTRDISETAYYLVMLAEAVLSYLVIVNLLYDMAASTIMRFMGSMVLLIISISVLSFFRVPGFAPFIPYEYGSPAYNAFIGSYYTRLSSPFLGLCNDLASVLAYFLFLGWAWYNVSRRHGYQVLTLIIMVSIILTTSKGVLLAIILTIPFFVRWQKIKIRKLVAPILAVALLSAMAFMAAYSFSEQFRVYYPNVFSIEHALSVSGRERLQRAAFGIAQVIRSPLYGYGAKVIPAAEESAFKGSMHNTYIEQVLWFGIPLGGLSVFSLLALPLIFLRNAEKAGVAFAIRSGIAAAIVCQLLIFSMEASFEGQFLKILFYVSVGFSVALINSLTGHERETVQGEAK